MMMMDDDDDDDDDSDRYGVIIISGVTWAYALLPNPHLPYGSDTLHSNALYSRAVGSRYYLELVYWQCHYPCISASTYSDTLLLPYYCYCHY